MKLDNAHILIAAQYSAPFEGNFIAQLKKLKDKLSSEFHAEIAFAFPKAMEQQPWADKFIKENIVFLTGNGSTLITEKEAKKIVADFNPTLIHTHFEGYDTCFHRLSKKCRIVWHMRDTLSFHANYLKALYQVYRFFMHYGIPFLGLGESFYKPCVIGVCSHEPKFIRKYRFGIKTTENIIPNGINLSRIDRNRRQSHDTFTFLAFAGRNVQKRVDLLLLAADRLIKKGCKIRVVIVDGHTPSVSDTIFETKPDWLIEIKPREDINSIFALADCFVSTSVHETFSNAIAEAAAFGLPVIQSDIESTMWNAGNPSAFLFKSKSVEDLARVMEELMKIPSSKLEEMTNISSDNIFQNYTLEAWSKKVIKFFCSIS